MGVFEGATAGLEGTGLGPSKKPPPLSGGGEETRVGAGDDLALTKLPRLAKGEAFGCGWGGADVVEEKLRSLKASLRPPKDDCGCACAGGDCMPLNEGVRPWSGDWV